MLSLARVTSSGTDWLSLPLKQLPIAVIFCFAPSSSEEKQKTAQKWRRCFPSFTVFPLLFYSIDYLKIDILITDVVANRQTSSFVFLLTADGGIALEGEYESF